MTTTNEERDTIDGDSERDRNKRKPFYKKEKPDKGYSSLLMAATASEEALTSAVDFQIFKGKKKHGFKLIKTKSEKKSADYEKKERRSSLKEEKRKKSKSFRESGTSTTELLEQLRLIVGLPLEDAVKRNPLSNNSGLAVPKFLLECIEIIDQSQPQENVYRHEAVKIKQAADLEYALKQPLTAGFAVSLLKRFFKELPEPILAHEPINAIVKIITDGAVGIANPACDLSDTTKTNEIRQILQKIPKCNRDTLHILFNHLYQIVTPHSTSTLLSSGGSSTNIQAQTVINSMLTVLKMKERVVKYFIQNVSELFDKQSILTTSVTPRVPLMKNVSRLSLLPDCVKELENELTKQENILNKMHEDMQKQTTFTFGTTTPPNVDKEKEEQLWTQQRMVTAIKRKIKQEKRRLQQTTLNRQSSSSLSLDPLSPSTFSIVTSAHRKSLLKDDQISQQVIVIVNKNKRDDTPITDRTCHSVTETPKTAVSSTSSKKMSDSDIKIQLRQRNKSDVGEIEIDGSGNDDDVFIKTLSKNKTIFMEKDEGNLMKCDYLKEKILEHRLIVKLKKIYEAFMQEKEMLAKLEQINQQPFKSLTSPEQQISPSSDTVPVMPPPLPQRPSEISQSQQQIMMKSLNNETIKLPLLPSLSLLSTNSDTLSTTKLKDDVIVQHLHCTSPDQKITILQELLNIIKQNNQLETKIEAIKRNIENESERIENLCVDLKYSRLSIKFQQLISNNNEKIINNNGKSNDQMVQTTKL